MKPIHLLFLFFGLLCHSQQYDNNWNQVMAFEDQGLMQSAYKATLKILKKATNDHNEPQVIKCFFYQSKFMLALDEDAQQKIYHNLENNIAQLSPPAKAILQIVKAKCLQQYHDRYRYQLSSGTETDSLGEFNTWSNETFIKQIRKAYGQSLANPILLKATSLKPYEQIFDFPAADKFNNQNLYGYILAENIQYYSPKTAIQTVASDILPSLFGTAPDFTSVPLTNIPEASRFVLNLYQEVERNEPTLENQLERIRFVHKRFIHNEALHFHALDAMGNLADNQHLQQMIWLDKAIILSDRASEIEFPEDNIKAIALLDSVAQFDNHSNAWQLARARKQNLSAKSLSVRVEKFIVPGQASRAFLSFRNIDSVSIRYYKINTDVAQKIPEYRVDKALVDSIVKNKPVISFTQRLPDKHDYFARETEVMLPPLKNGTYLMYCCTSDTSLPVYASQIVTASNFMLSTRTVDDVERVTVLDRHNGLPVEGVKIEVASFSGLSDNQGQLRIKKTEKNYNTREWIRAVKGTDTLQVYNESNWYRMSSKADDAEEIEAKVDFFLDRGIYRPGQKVQYKGIVMQKRQGKTSVGAHLNFEVYVENEDGDEVFRTAVTTNDMGSFWGEFNLPAITDTGRFEISVDEPDEDEIEKDPGYDHEQDEHPFWDYVMEWEGRAFFQVEEYKRPKFEVNLNPITSCYGPLDKVVVTGTAHAFSGGNVSNATVRYTVLDGENEYRWSSEDTLAVSSTTTDASGKFTIAIDPRPTNDPKRTYHYHVQVSVTDTDGETHDAKLFVVVSPVALKLRMMMPRQIRINQKNNLSLVSENANGQPLPAKGELSVYYLGAFPNKFKRRLFERPKDEIIPPDVFAKNFPNESTGDTRVWPEKPLVIQKVDTSKQPSIPMDILHKGQPGYYEVVFSAKDQWGNLVEQKANFEVFPAVGFIPNQALTLQQKNTNPSKDGFLEFSILSPIASPYVTVSAAHDGRFIFSESVQLKNHEGTLKIPLEKSIWGNVAILAETVYDNAFFKEQLTSFIPENRTHYSFTAESFRNKIEPGSHEHWTFNLASSSGMRAEVLASMYDLSLDQFASSDWPDLSFNTPYGYIHEQNYLGTGIGIMQVYGLGQTYIPLQLRNEKTDLIWFGFDFSGHPNVSAKTYKEQRTRKIKKPANAQTITGIVSDETGTLPGANVVVAGTKRGVQTDVDGYFSIEAAPGEELVFSFVGMEDKTVKLGNEKNLSVRLDNFASKLQEVVVEGYRMEKKKSAVSASTVTVGSDLAMSLEGRVAGLDIRRDSVGFATKVIIRGIGSANGAANPLIVVDGVVTDAKTFGSLNPDELESVSVLKGAEAEALYGSLGAGGVIIVTTKKALEKLGAVKSRKNLSETAFFFPNLQTGKDDKLTLDFTSPEALTQWKLRLFAHDKTGGSGFLQSIVTTQRDLMAIPNFPRFLREKDTIWVSSKVANLTATTKTGAAMLTLTDAATAQNLSSAFVGGSTKNFTAAPFSSTVVRWQFIVPRGVSGIQYKVIAQSGNFSDGEENILPVLTNDMLVTESMALWVREGQKKTFTFANLKNNHSATLRQHQLTVSYTSNPTWLAIESLPYLMEYEHECSEQTFARFYANALAAEIIADNPKIGALIASWKTDGKPSKLDENPLLKSTLLAETPWFNDAADEQAKKQRLALLFDLDKMKDARVSAWEKLLKKQKSSGGFSWFDGGPENPYITRHILAGLGHLKKLAPQIMEKDRLKAIADKAIPYLDALYMARTDAREAGLRDDLHMLYARSFFLDDYPASDAMKKKINLSLAQFSADKFDYGLQAKTMMALVFSRYGQKDEAHKIVMHLRETAVHHPENGMYWLANRPGWYWYDAPVETQALLIEAFAELRGNTSEIDEMKVWLLKNKQQKNWCTTKATTEAIYALLMTGTDWLSVKDNTVLEIGDEKLKTKKWDENAKEAETGYVKLSWKADEINNSMAALTIQNKSKAPGYGGFFWQYFEDLDQIKSADGALTVTKSCYVKTAGEESKGKPITAITPLKVGDLVRVQLVIKADSDVDYVHLKDMRASCFEPVDVISTYHWNGGLDYYQSTRDAATHFFFDRIYKGTHVLEYDIRVTNAGYFSNGITTIQSMYAPEYASHTKGITFKVNP